MTAINQTLKELCMFSVTSIAQLAKQKPADTATEITHNIHSAVMDLRQLKQRIEHVIEGLEKQGEISASGWCRCD